MRGNLREWLWSKRQGKISVIEEQRHRDSKNLFTLWDSELMWSLWKTNWKFLKKLIVEIPPLQVLTSEKKYELQ